MDTKNFSKMANMPYTRKEYMGGIPGSKIRRFTIGNTNKKFDCILELRSLNDVQIRHNALEAARIATNRVLENVLERKNYYIKIVPYPHHVLREHKLLAVAQADRFQEGMRQAYGKPVGVAARVFRNDTIIIVKVDSNYLKLGKEALRRGSHKLPAICKIIVNN